MNSVGRLDRLVTSSTLFDKVWAEHEVANYGDGFSLLYVDRHFIHDLAGRFATQQLAKQDLKVRNPGLTFATADHTVSTDPVDNNPPSDLIPGLQEFVDQWNIRYFESGSGEQGIVHVIGPELGLTQPGLTIVCGDSHTCTHGAFGALAFGIGSSELMHVLATQSIVQRKPMQLHISVDGALPQGVMAKDLILHIIGIMGASAGTGFAVQYSGSAIESLSVEQRMTICNMSIELGAKIGMMAPDDKIFNYLVDKDYAPTGAQWDNAVAYWRTLSTDVDATFDKVISIDAGHVAPQITWGTSLDQILPLSGVIPDPSLEADQNRRETMRAALGYMGLQANTPIGGTPINRVFIGSCVNSRLSDLREAARQIQGRRVANEVTAWVVPGSEGVKQSAEAEGLDKIFRQAGFDWRNPGCSMCCAVNGDVVAPGERCVSTSNRNFVGRQGPDARTHIASPITAVESAIAGCIRGAPMHNRNQ